MGAGISQAELESRFDTEVSPEIRSEIENACRSTQEATQDLVIRDVEDSEVTGITQEALFDNSCKLSGAIEAATAAEASQELISSLQATQSTSGLFALSSQNTDVINEIVTEVSPEIINEVLSECVNEQSAKQSLTIEQIKGSSVSDILQTNKQYNDCVIDAFLKNETTAASATRATTKADVEQTLDVSFFDFGILFVAIILIFLFPGLLARGAGKGIGQLLFFQSSVDKSTGMLKPPSFIGGIVAWAVIIGIISLVIWWFTRDDDEETPEEFTNVTEPKNSKNTELDYQVYAQ